MLRGRDLATWAQAPYLPVFEECRLVTNVHRIADTIGDAWPLVAVDRRPPRQAAGEGATAFGENRNLTDHDAAIRHDGSLDRLSACVNATAASPLGKRAASSARSRPTPRRSRYPIAASVATSRSATSSGWREQAPRRGSSARTPSDDR